MSGEELPAVAADDTDGPPPFELGAITSDPIKSVADLIDLSELLLGSPPNPLHSWAFRGQAQAFGTLVPSFQRSFERKSEGAAEKIEHRMIEAFRTHYADLKDRSEEIPASTRFGAQRDLLCLSVMQHYEIPTRLLDWSSDMWTAIYFACASDPANHAELWCYDRTMFQAQRTNNWDLTSLVDKSDSVAPEPVFLVRRSEALIVELDPQITPRMKQQKAHHMVSTNVFSDHAPLIYDLQMRYYPPDQTGGLRRFLIEDSCKGKALQFFAEEMEITASTIFPDVVVWDAF